MSLVFAVVLGARRNVTDQLKSDIAATPVALAAAGPAATEFPSNFKWLNTDKPLSLRALRGKIVLLDFWTYGCINCMHVLPDLKKLERKYPNELVIISVHSAKFENESDSANIRNAMMRYNIEHPVLVDQNMRVWNSFGVNAWPTFVLIDPAGNVVGKVAGEGQYGVLDTTIGRVARDFRKSGKLNTTPLKFALESAKVAATPLRYPGKVLADATSNRLFIADSNHNRIIISDMAGNVKAVAGSGVYGLNDGGFDEATFKTPHGMALSDDKNLLYVADTENHAIRVLDLKKGTVATLAGTGQQAKWGSTGGVGTKAALASPWDVEVVKNPLTPGSTMFIAMAGPHQIWAMDMESKEIRVYAGSGREARIDGVATEAALAQPSGLSTDGRSLFFADSESSSVRAVDTLRSGVREQVRTLAGGGSASSLFDFGDVDGSGAAVRLQHPLAVEYSGGRVFVADTYNHKIKVIDLETNRIETFAGSARGKKDGAATAAQFYEPGGLSLADGKLYIADTNNHAIRVLDLTSKQVSTLQLKNVPRPQPAEPARAPKSLLAKDDDTITLPAVQLAPGTRGQLVLDVKLPAGHHLNKESPQRFAARVEGSGATLARNSVPTSEFKLPLMVPLTTQNTGQGVAIVNTTVFYCTDEKGACLVRQMRVRVPFEIVEGGSTKLTMPLEITSSGDVKVRAAG
jgi:DNA-binding beta-propeller fold protein YncE